MTVYNWHESQTKSLLPPAISAIGGRSLQSKKMKPTDIELKEQYEKFI